MKLCLSCDARFAAPGWTCPRCGAAPPEDPFPRFTEPVTAIDRSGSEELSLRLAQAEPGSFWFRARNRLLVWVLRRHFPRAGSLLEVGCGAGFALQGVREAFPAMHLVGGDPYPPALRVARQRLPGVELLQLDGGNLPFEGEFDVALALDVLEHLADERPMLEQLRRAVRPGGGVIITVPQHRWLWGAADDFALHQRRYVRGELLDRLREAGLEPLWGTSFVSLLVPAMALARLLPSRQARYDPVAELRPGRALNRVLEAGLDIERRLFIERGRSLPAGGSLLMLARAPG
ncbi:MAG: class I SAM-dependent methyltransferase [Solirubrobacteraceae bacterium]